MLRTDGTLHTQTDAAVQDLPHAGADVEKMQRARGERDRPAVVICRRKRAPVERYMRRRTRPFISRPVICERADRSTGCRRTTPMPFATASVHGCEKASLAMDRFVPPETYSL